MVIALAVAFNVSLNTSKTNNASLLALANVEALAQSEQNDALAWGAEIDCPGLGTGDYHECVHLGSGNSCSNKGDTTCTCGTNC